MLNAPSMTNAFIVNEKPSITPLKRNFDNLHNVLTQLEVNPVFFENISKYVLTGEEIDNGVPASPEANEFFAAANGLLSKINSGISNSKDRASEYSNTLQKTLEEAWNLPFDDENSSPFLIDDGGSAKLTDIFQNENTISLVINSMLPEGGKVFVPLIGIIESNGKAIKVTPITECELFEGNVWKPKKSKNGVEIPPFFLAQGAISQRRNTGGLIESLRNMWKKVPNWGPPLLAVLVIASIVINNYRSSSIPDSQVPSLPNNPSSGENLPDGSVGSAGGTGGDDDPPKPKFTSNISPTPTFELSATPGVTLTPTVGPENPESYYIEIAKNVEQNYELAVREMKRINDSSGSTNPANYGDVESNPKLTKINQQILELLQSGNLDKLGEDFISRMPGNFLLGPGIVPKNFTISKAALEKAEAVGLVFIMPRLNVSNSTSMQINKLVGAQVTDLVSFNLEGIRFDLTPGEVSGYPITTGEGLVFGDFDPKQFFSQRGFDGATWIEIKINADELKISSDKSGQSIINGLMILPSDSTNSWQNFINGAGAATRNTILVDIGHEIIIKSSDLKE